MKPRRLKCAVGRCKICDSDAVLSRSGKYSDGKRHWSVVCSNKDCGRRTPGGYDSEDAAWQKGAAT